MLALCFWQLAALGVLLQARRGCLHFYRCYRHDPWLRSVQCWRRCLPWRRAALLYLLISLPLLAAQTDPLFCLGLQTAALLLLLLALFDLKFLVLPDALLCLLAAVGSWLAWHEMRWPAQLEGLLFAAAFAFLLGVAAHLLGKSQIGCGDLKFIVVSGAWLDPQGCLLMCVAACTLTLAVHCLWSGLRYDRLGSADHAVPLGPGLAAGFWLVLIYSAAADGRIFR